MSEFNVQVTEWFPTKEELSFAVKQIEDYGDKCEIKEREDKDRFSLWRN